MFTIEQINDVHDCFGSASTFTEYVLAPPGHEVLTVAKTGQGETFLEHLRRHQAGVRRLLSRCQRLGAKRRRKWTIASSSMTMTYYDKAGIPMLVEQVK